MQPKSNKFLSLPIRSLAAAIGVITLLILLPCCKRTSPDSTVSPGPYDGMVLRIACPGDPSAAIVKQSGQAWARREGATIDVRLYEPGGDPSEDADVWMIAPAELGRWVSAGTLEAVPPSYLSDSDSYGWRSSLLQDFRDLLLRWGRKSYAMPLLGESPLCYYRTDYFQSLEREQKKKLVPPNTWEEFADAAEFESRQRQGEPVLPPLPDRAEELDRLFYSVAGCYARRAVREDSTDQPPEVETFSFHYDRETGQARINKPGFVEALKLLQRLQRVRFPGTHPSPPEAFADGRAVLCLADASWIDRFEKGKVRGKYGISQLPGSHEYYSYQAGEPIPVTGSNRVPYLGSAGWLAVVPKRSSHPEAAFALLANLTGRETSRRIVHDPRWGGGAFRREHLENPRDWFGFGLDQPKTLDLIGSLRQTLVHPGLKNPLIRLRTPDEREHMLALVAELRPALLENRDASETLNSVARRWQEIDNRKDPKARLQEYNLSLGKQTDQ